MCIESFCVLGLDRFGFSGSVGCDLSVLNFPKRVMADSPFHVVCERGVREAWRCRALFLSWGRQGCSWFRCFVFLQESAHW